MKSRDQDHLLRAVVTDEALESLREETLGRGLAATRLRRRRRKLLQASAIAAAPALVLAIGVLRHQSPATHTAMVVRHPAVDAPADLGVKKISDAELLALFPDRSVGLIGKPGDQELVFFDESAEP